MTRLPVLEDARLPDELIAEVVDLRLVGRRFTLQRLQGNRVGADLVRRLALLAGDALQPVQDLGALGIEGVEQAGKQQFSASGLVGCTVQIFGDRLLRFLERGPPCRQLCYQRADLGVVLPFAGDVVERRARPHRGKRNLGHLGLGARPVRIARIGGMGEPDRRRNGKPYCDRGPIFHASPPAGPRRIRPRDGS